LAVPTTAQITPFGRGTNGHRGDQFAAHIGGYRMSHGRRDVTLGNETPGWPSQPPAALHGVIGNFPV